MSNANQTTENKIFMCTQSQCGMLFRAEVGSKCPSCRDGKVKSYNANGAIIMNSLDRTCYEVHSFTIPNDTDLKREIMIVLADKYEFTPAPPEGFTLEHANVPPDASGNKMSVTLLYKRYRVDMPNWEYALELAQDKARLTEWVFSLPDVTAIMHSPCNSC